MKRYGGIEAGGTKFVCVVGSSPETIEAEIRFANTGPEETLRRAADFFHAQALESPLAGIGVGSFGPLDLNPKSPTYGFITTTPKLEWANTDFTGYLEQSLQLPVVIDTDVNAAAYGEYVWGAAKGVDHLVYNTIGTGIGAGVIIDGHPIHGLSHPEMGHIFIPHDRVQDPFAGVCPYHRDCFEGLASGSAIRSRWGMPAEQLPDDHPAWELQAHYIALALVNQICTLSPQRVVLGGGVMKHLPLYEMVQSKVRSYLNGYVNISAVLSGIESYIVPPSLGDRSGCLGAIALARYQDEVRVIA